MNRLILPTTLALAAAPFIMRGAEAPDPLNRFTLGGTIGFNFKASFRKTPSAPSAINPGPAAGGSNHAYDDGYVRLDSSGDSGGLTWNWGYQNSAQVVGDSMHFHASDPNPAFAGYNRKVSDDPQYGLELMYQRVIGPVSSAGRWGFEAAFGYTDMDIANTSSGPGQNRLTTDIYPLNGILPPGAGHAGNFVGPSALLGDTPTRNITTDALTSRENLSGQLLNFRLGPFVEWSFTPKLSLGVSVGPALTPASVDYGFTETTLLAGGGTGVARGYFSHDELLYGFYAGATLQCDFSHHWGAYIGGRFQHLNSMEETVAGRTARLDLGATIQATIGIRYRF